MTRYPNRAAATAVSAAAAALLAYPVPPGQPAASSASSAPEPAALAARRARRRGDGTDAARVARRMFVATQRATRRPWPQAPTWASAKCESLLDAIEPTESEDARDPRMNYYYRKMDPGALDRTSSSHAVFGALRGAPGLIERFDVYRRVTLEKATTPPHPGTREVTVVDVKLGTRLNGHGGIVHGGIISLLFDEAMG